MFGVQASVWSLIKKRKTCYRSATRPLADLHFLEYWKLNFKLSLFIFDLVMSKCRHWKVATYPSLTGSRRNTRTSGLSVEILGCFRMLFLIIGDVCRVLSQNSAEIAASASEIFSMQHEQIMRNGRFPYWKIDHFKQACHSKASFPSLKSTKTTPSTAKGECGWRRSYKPQISTLKPDNRQSRKVTKMGQNTPL